MGEEKISQEQLETMKKRIIDIMLEQATMAYKNKCLQEEKEQIIDKIEQELGISLKPRVGEYRLPE